MQTTTTAAAIPTARYSRINVRFECRPNVDDGNEGEEGDEGEASPVLWHGTSVNNSVLSSLVVLGAFVDSVELSKNPSEPLA